MNTFISERGEDSPQMRKPTSLLRNFFFFPAQWKCGDLILPQPPLVSRPKLLSPLHTCCCCHVNEMHISSRSAPLEWKGKYLHYARGPECTRRPAIPLTRVYEQNNTVLTLISLLLSVKWSYISPICVCVNVCVFVH